MAPKAIVWAGIPTIGRTVTVRLPDGRECPAKVVFVISSPKVGRVANVRLPWGERVDARV